MSTLDEELTRLRHRGLAWNTPLSTGHADRLLDLLEVRPTDRLLDLGCGWGGLLLRALARQPGSTGVGVDINEGQLERGRELARLQGVSERVRFIATDVTRHVGDGDRAICIGASHAWGGTRAALTAFRTHLLPGGRGLFGDGFWMASPSPQLVNLLGDVSASLAELAEVAIAAGLRPLYIDTASELEWDEFEWNAFRGLEEFALSDPTDPIAKKARASADLRRAEYLRGYRGVLGFAYLVVARA
jgi:SAM-dependent methyltransferase